MQFWSSSIKFTIWIKLIHLCAFKYKFGNVRLYCEEGGLKWYECPRLKTRLIGPCTVIFPITVRYYVSDEAYTLMLVENNVYIDFFYASL